MINSFSVERYVTVVTVAFLRGIPLVEYNITI